MMILFLFQKAFPPLHLPVTCVPLLVVSHGVADRWPLPLPLSIAGHHRCRCRPNHPPVWRATGLETFTSLRQRPCRTPSPNRHGKAVTGVQTLLFRSLQTLLQVFSLLLNIEKKHLQLILLCA